jgi:hypothetical protein
MVVGVLKIEGEGRFCWLFVYCCGISAISALGALFLTDMIPFLQFSFDSYASPEDAMICPFGDFSLHLYFPAVSLYISNFGIADNSITWVERRIYFIKVVFDMFVLKDFMLDNVWFGWC